MRIEVQYTGTFSTSDVLVGPYKIEVEKEGFRTFHMAGVELTVPQVLTVSATLQAGATSESVEVRADRLPDIDLETTQISNLVNQRQMQQIPLITRDP
jgi:hypothetical protein